MFDRVLTRRQVKKHKTVALGMIRNDSTVGEGI